MHYLQIPKIIELRVQLYKITVIDILNFFYQEIVFSSDLIFILGIIRLLNDRNDHLQCKFAHYFKLKKGQFCKFQPGQIESYKKWQ
jgi:hypothetical protein